MKLLNTGWVVVGIHSNMSGVTSIYIPPDIRAEIDELKRKTHKPMSIIIREALQEYMEKIKGEEALQKFIRKNFGGVTPDMERLLKKLIEEVIEERNEGGGKNDAYNRKP